MKKFLTVLLSALLVAASLPLAAFAQTASEETPVSKAIMFRERLSCVWTAAAPPRAAVQPCRSCWLVRSRL